MDRPRTLLPCRGAFTVVLGLTLDFDRYPVAVVESILLGATHIATALKPRRVVASLLAAAELVANTPIVLAAGYQPTFTWRVTHRTGAVVEGAIGALLSVNLLIVTILVDFAVGGSARDGALGRTGWLATASRP